MHQSAEHEVIETATMDFASFHQRKFVFCCAYNCHAERRLFLKPRELDLFEINVTPAESVEAFVDRLLRGKDHRQPLIEIEPTVNPAQFPATPNPPPGGK